MLPPTEFIPIAESTGLIVGLGRWVLEQALRDATSWPADVAVAVNLSSTQIEQTSFFGDVSKALQGAGVEPSRLQLEITETVLLSDHHQTRASLGKLGKLGVSLSLDDFGTSFANLSYLREFPIDRLKIDRSFVHEVPQDEDCSVIVTSVAELAHKLHLLAVAEGVETLANLRAVQAASYDEAQGFYFSLPIPAHAVARTILQCEKRLSGVNGLAA
jgi:EAL domain-containing protein (putative c-di-GMP-specific phosphodiesterase class I)